MPALAMTDKRESQLPRYSLGLLTAIGLVVLILFFMKWLEGLNEQTWVAGLEVGVESKKTNWESPKVRLDFSPPAYLDSEQLSNIKMAEEIVRNPASWGLTDKAPIHLDHNALQVYLSLLGYENQYRHYDETGEVAVSYNDCCVGIAQVNLNTSVCAGWELADIRRNLWCGAKIFEGYYNEWAPKAGDRDFEIAVAMYKNAVLMTPDLSTVVLGTDGLPIIPADDPTDPMDFFSQVQSVFIDPMTGLPRFKFTVGG